MTGEDRQHTPARRRVGCGVGGRLECVDYDRLADRPQINVPAVIRAVRPLCDRIIDHSNHYYASPHRALNCTYTSRSTATAATSQYFFLFHLPGPIVFAHPLLLLFHFFFLKDPAPPEISPLPLPAPLPI